MEVRNIFSNIPEKIEKEIFECLAANNSVMIERIISKGQESPWFDQNFNEWVIVLRGSAILSFDNQPIVQLNAGDFINIPAHTKHKVSWTNPDTETVWLAVHYCS